MRFLTSLTIHFKHYKTMTTILIIAFALSTISTLILLALEKGLKPAMWAFTVSVASLIVLIAGNYNPRQRDLSAKFDAINTEWYAALDSCNGDISCIASVSKHRRGQIKAVWAWYNNGELQETVRQSVVNHNQWKSCIRESHVAEMQAGRNYHPGNPIYDNRMETRRNSVMVAYADYERASRSLNTTSTRPVDPWMSSNEGPALQDAEVIGSVWGECSAYLF